MTLILALFGGLAVGIFAKARSRMHPLAAAALFAVGVQITGWLVYGPDKDGHFNALYGSLEAAVAAFAVILGSAAASVFRSKKESE